MKINTIIIITLIGLATIFGFHKKGTVTLIAQSVPYLATVAWDMNTDLLQPGDVVTYNGFLDSAPVSSCTAVTAPTCVMSISSLGTHTVGISAHVDSYVPPDSQQAILIFNLNAPKKVTGVKVK